MNPVLHEILIESVTFIWNMFWYDKYLKKYEEK
jgi:hypothetical protein